MGIVNLNAAAAPLPIPSSRRPLRSWASRIIVGSAERMSIHRMASNLGHHLLKLMIDPNTPAAARDAAEAVSGISGRLPLSGVSQPAVLQHRFRETPWLPVGPAYWFPLFLELGQPESEIVPVFLELSTPVRGNRLSIKPGARSSALGSPSIEGKSGARHRARPESGEAAPPAAAQS